MQIEILMEADAMVSHGISLIGHCFDVKKRIKLKRFRVIEF